MPLVQTHVYSAPFDAVADRYDEVFTESAIGRAQRASVWQELEKVFHAEQRVLEIGCGTGVDACFLAGRGVAVVACDSSSRMIAATTRKIQERGMQSLVRPLFLPAEEIDELQIGRPFDGAFSNFGALNCVQDVRALARNLADLLRPGATALLCWMSPCCLWEVTWYLAHARPSKALRRLRRGGDFARLADGMSIRVHYPSVRELARTFAPEFRLKSFTGIGVAVPPSYVERWAQRFPQLLSLAITADRFLGRCPGLRALADHVLLRFERLPYD